MSFLNVKLKIKSIYLESKKLRKKKIKEGDSETVYYVIWDVRGKWHTETNLLFKNCV